MNNLDQIKLLAHGFTLYTQKLRWDWKAFSWVCHVMVKDSSNRKWKQINATRSINEHLQLMKTYAEDVRSIYVKPKFL